MKKWIVCLVLPLILTGCGAGVTLETVHGDLEEPAAARPREISVELPGEAAVPAVESDSGRIYTCGDYDLAIQTLESGDLDATVQSLTGFAREALTVVETRQEGMPRYDFVWASAGEEGDQVGRAVILDDGNYHYTMTVLRDAEGVETQQVVWSHVFSTFRLA